MDLERQINGDKKWNGFEISIANTHNKFVWHEQQPQQQKNDEKKKRIMQIRIFAIFFHLLFRSLNLFLHFFFLSCVVNGAHTYSSIAHMKITINVCHLNNRKKKFFFSANTKTNNDFDTEKYLFSYFLHFLHRLLLRFFFFFEIQTKKK